MKLADLRAGLQQRNSDVGDAKEVPMQRPEAAVAPTR